MVGGQFWPPATGRLEQLAFHQGRGRAEIAQAELRSTPSTSQRCQAGSTDLLRASSCGVLLLFAAAPWFSRAWRGFR